MKKLSLVVSEEGISYEEVLSDGSSSHLILWSSKSQEWTAVAQQRIS